MPSAKPARIKKADLDLLALRYSDVQLATLVDTPPEGENWVHEIKLDGYRLLGYVSGGAARLRTRNGKDWTARFPSVIEALQKLPIQDAVLDMEAVIYDRNGHSSFQSLQTALGNQGNTRAIVACAFDLLHLNGEDLTSQSLTQRKDKLQRLLPPSRTDPHLRYSDHVVGDGSAMLSKACDAGLEGIVSKSAAAPYVPGRQKSWLKIKCSLRQEFIILGYSDARAGDRSLGALYLGYSKEGHRKDDQLQYAGKVGTGFSIKSARELTQRFASLASPAPVLLRPQTPGLTAAEYRDIHWIKPEVLCEVSFTEWTDDGRIRHPSFQGLREDKSAAEVRAETLQAAEEKPMPPPTATTPEPLVLNGIAITHPDRVISETGHVTKGELADYYSQIAPLILPHLAGRPISLLRCPSGIGDKCFFQRNPGRGLGKDVHPFTFNHKGKKYEYLYIDDERGLLEMVQMGAIEIHPWGAPVATIHFPDRMIFDLDPAPEVPFEAVKFAAQDLRSRLREKGLEAALKCTGGKGLHLTVPLAGEDKWPVVKAFARSVAEEMVAAVPEAYIATMSKAKRTGKIFIDFFRNDYTATAIVDYGVRARPGAPVAVPLEWKELNSLRSADQFTMKDVLKRINKKPPAWPAPQSLPR